MIAAPSMPLALALLLCGSGSVSAPPRSSGEAPKAAILGVWKGSSTCTKVEGNEFCHDETVVYNVIDVPGRSDTVKMKAARIVNGRIEPMYELFFTYRPESGAWTSEFKRQSHSGIWSYAIHDETMTGDAKLLPSNTLVRNVSVKRIPKDQALAP